MTTTRIEDLIAPALADYVKALESHGRDWDAGGTTCTCGWTYNAPSSRSASRALSLHITAAQKRAEKSYDATVATLIKEGQDD